MYFAIYCRSQQKLDEVSRSQQKLDEASLIQPKPVNFVLRLAAVYLPILRALRAGR